MNTRGPSGGYFLVLALAWPLACADDDEAPQTGDTGGNATVGGRASGGARVTGGSAGAGGDANAGRGADAGAGGGANARGGADAGAGGDANAGRDAGAGAGGNGNAAGATGEGNGGEGGTAIGGTAGASAGSTGTGGTPVVLNPPVVFCVGQGGGGAGGVGGTDENPEAAAVAATDAGAGGTLGSGVAGADSGGAEAQEESADAYGSLTKLGSRVQPVAINQSGQVVAVVATQTGTAATCRSFLVDGRAVREIRLSDDDPCTRAHDINDAGLVAGSVGDPPRSFLWQDGVATVLTGVTGRPVALNNQNQVVFDSGLLWAGGLVTALTVPGGGALLPVAMNDSGQIVGTPAASEQAYLWHDGSALALPFDSPKAINDLGHIVGIRDSLFGLGRAVGIWDGSVFHEHSSTLNVSTSLPIALNNHDELAGTRDESPGDWPASPFVGTASRFARLAVAGEAYDLNDRGDVIGVQHEIRWMGGIWNRSYAFIGLEGLVWSRSCFLACCP